MKNKIILTLLILTTTFSIAFSQEPIDTQEIEKSNEQTQTLHKINISPFVIVGNHIILNTVSSQSTFFTPIKFFIGGGAIIDFNSNLLITLQPNLNIWNMYYAYDTNGAYASEVENRTATTICLLFDIPLGIKFTKGKHSFTPGVGLGFLLRFSFLSNGVKPSDPGITGSAENDLAEISKWNWSNCRFLYPELFFAWDYQISSNFAFGLIAKMYFSLASFIEHKNLNDAILNLSARFTF